MILTSFYTANLTAFLTLSKFTLHIKKIDDIANGEYQWISSEGSAVEYIVKVGNDLKPLKQSMFDGNGQFMVINIDEIDTILKYISSGNKIKKIFIFMCVINFQVIIIYLRFYLLYVDVYNWYL